MTTIRSFLSGICFCVLLGHCADEPVPTSSIQAALVVDSAVFRVVKSFSVYVLSASTGQGAGGLTCEVVHARGRFSVGQYQVLAQTTIPWNGATTEATASKIEVPANQPLLVVALAASDADGKTIVASGCHDTAPIAPGKSGNADIDVVATTGAPCKDENQCEPGQACITGIGFDGGYCAKLNCQQNSDCPPASICVNDAAGGTSFCGRRCILSDDCIVTINQQIQSCVRRTGPAGCVQVCVYNQWNTQGACQ